MFKHALVPQKIILEHYNLNDGIRYYYYGDRKYPSITSVLSSVSDKKFLDVWAERIGVDNAKRYSRKAALRGTKIHLLCENFLLNKEINVDELSFLDKRSFNQISKILKKRVSCLIALEIPLYSDMIKIGGRCDCVAIFDGKLSIIDFKTSKFPKEEEHIRSYFIQETFYAVAFGELYGKLPEQIVTIICNDSLNEPQVFIKETKNYMGDLVEVKRCFDNDEKFN